MLCSIEEARASIDFDLNRSDELEAEQTQDYTAVNMVDAYRSTERSFLPLKPFIGVEPTVIM